MERVKNRWTCKELETTCFSVFDDSFEINFFIYSGTYVKSSSVNYSKAEEY